METQANGILKSGRALKALVKHGRKMRREEKKRMARYLDALIERCVPQESNDKEV